MVAPFFSRANSNGGCDSGHPVRDSRNQALLFLILPMWPSAAALSCGNLGRIHFCSLDLRMAKYSLLLVRLRWEITIAAVETVLLSRREIPEKGVPTTSVSPLKRKESRQFGVGPRGLEGAREGELIRFLADAAPGRPSTQSRSGAPAANNV